VAIAYNFADGRIWGGDKVFFFLVKWLRYTVCRCSGRTVALLRMGVSMKEVLGKIAKSLAVSIFDKNDYEFRL
jgi:hypothetical protein